MRISKLLRLGSLVLVAASGVAGVALPAQAKQWVTFLDLRRQP